MTFIVVEGGGEKGRGAGGERNPVNVLEADSCSHLL